MQRIIVFTLSVLFTASAFAGNWYGTWRGERYDFRLSGSNFYGSWGDDRSDFRKSGNNIYGKVAGVRFDFRKSGSNIYGTFPCGRSDYRISGKNVYGKYCDSRFDIYFASEREAEDYAYSLAMDSITDLLPSPVRSVVRMKFEF